MSVTFLYCDWKLKNIGDGGFFFSLSAHRTGQETIVFHLKLQARYFVMEVIKASLHWDCHQGSQATKEGIILFCEREVKKQ